MITYAKKKNVCTAYYKLLKFLYQRLVLIFLPPHIRGTHDISINTINKKVGLKTPLYKR